jgi:hypothetical protein
MSSPDAIAEPAIGAGGADDAETLVDPEADSVDAMFDSLVARLTAEGLDPVREDIDRLQWIQRQEAMLRVDRAETMMRIVNAESATDAGSGPLDLVMRTVTAELAAALRLADRTVQAQLSEAWSLTTEFPATVEALRSGSISVGHARVIMSEGAVLQDADRRADFEGAVLERAATVTPGRLRRVARMAAERLTDRAFEERHERARQERRVVTYETADGMSEVVATVPTVFAAGIADRLSSMAKAVAAAEPDDPRTRDQLRADVFCELLLTGDPTGDPEAPHAAANGIRAEIAVVIPFLTLLGQGEEPATIAGRGPIGMADALRLAAEAPSLLRILTDPVTEEILAVDGYRPTERLRRYLRYRDGRCRYPSCNRSAARSDIDHTIPYSEGGRTEPGNLACLCPGHHTIKHLPGWAVRQVSPGVLEWTTPHGLTVFDRPDTPVRSEQD